MAQAIDDVINLVEDWPKEPRESARRLIDYYGPPQECCRSELIWYATRDGWKRTVLSREEIPHDFPSPHTDYLEQFIDYRVPIGMFSKLAEYDGSVIAERTKGELSARCGGTSMNFVAINLAHDIRHRDADRCRSAGGVHPAVCRVQTRRETSVYAGLPVPASDRRYKGPRRSCHHVAANHERQLLRPAAVTGSDRASLRS